MKGNVDTLIDVPCFKCLFWDCKKESHLYCNPKECEMLTKWLLKQVKEYCDNETILAVEADLKEYNVQ
jgi:hypothetical protein